MSARDGYISEIFCSIQGEGLHVGQRQIFLRTAGCSTECAYCDTVYSKARTENCIVYAPGQRELPNPLGVSQVMDEIQGLSRKYEPVRTVSITGGEPLEQSDFVAGVSGLLKEANFTVHLDTNGIHASGLKKVIPFLDVVAMDFKLPSSAGRSYWREHRECLRLIARKEVFIKLVVDESTLTSEIMKAAEVLASADRAIPLVLQPESGALFSGNDRRDALMARVFEYQRLALRTLKDVRIIPQYHRILAMR